MRAARLAGIALLALPAAILALPGASTSASACGAPISAEEIMHGRIPTEDNMPCQPSRSQPAPPPRPNPQDAERALARENCRKAQVVFEQLSTQAGLDLMRMSCPQAGLGHLVRQFEDRAERERVAAKAAAEARRQREVARAAKTCANAQGSLKTLYPARRAAQGRVLAVARSAQDYKYLWPAIGGRYDGDIGTANDAADKSCSTGNRADVQAWVAQAKADDEQQRQAMAKVAEAQFAALAQRSAGPAAPDGGRSGGGISNSGSCSDITGLGDGGGAPARDCRSGNSALAAARITRTANPAAAGERYRAAADAFRRAGDIAMANAIIAEMNALVAALPSSPPSPPPAARQAPPADAPDAKLADTPCGQSLQQARPYIEGAQAIEKNDATCPGLIAAAHNYFEAGRIFLTAVPIDTRQEALADTCEYRKSQEMFSRSTALQDLVDRMKQEGRCGGARVATRRGPDNNGRGDDPARQKCDGDQSALDQMQKVADAMANMGTAGNGGRSEQAVQLDIEISNKRLELASQGCKKVGAPPPTALECSRAKLKWGLKDGLSPEEVLRRAAKAGCK